jgi:hypothetical protein
MESGPVVLLFLPIFCFVLFVMEAVHFFDFRREDLKGI